MVFRGIRGQSAVVTVEDGEHSRELELPALRTSGWMSEARHSPTGFEWGYLGSGPAELARAVLITVFPGDDVVRHPACYQYFKQDVIARLDRDRFVIDEADVRAWRALWDVTDNAHRAHVAEAARLEVERLDLAEREAGLEEASC